MLNHKSPLKALHQQGLRLTRQRRLILDVLEKSQEHLDAETLFILAKQQDPRVSLATVYRTLSLLKEVGVILEHQLGENHGHFETVQAAPHFHFSCLKCGRVMEFDAPQVIEAARQLTNQKGIQITQMHLHFSGYCANCRKNENNSPTKSTSSTDAKPETDRA